MPYVFRIIVYDTDGTTAMANLRTYLRNESTNEQTYANTNSSGEVVFNLGNLTEDWSRGDKFTYYVMYRGYESYATYTIPSTGGGYNTTLTLTALTTAPSLRYFTVQDFLDYFNINIYADDLDKGIKTQQIIKIGEMVEKKIDSDTNRVFDDNSGDYYSVTNEYHDSTLYNQKDFYLDHRPIYAITKVQTTDSAEGSSVTWDTVYDLSGGTGQTYYFDYDKKTGRLSILKSTYRTDIRRAALRCTYTYGTSTTPADIKELAIVETGLRLLGASVVKGKITGTDQETGNVNWFNIYKAQVIDKYRS